MFLMPVWSPMRHSLFKVLADRPDIRFKVLFEKRNLSHRPSWQVKSGTGYDWEVIDSYHPGLLKRYRLIPFRLARAVKSHTPDVFVVMSVTQALFALACFYRKKTAIILWTGESSHILSRRSAPWIASAVRDAVYPFLDGFACYSNTTRRFLRKRFRIPTQKLFTLPQCTDNNHFNRKRDERLSPPKKFTFLIVSRFTRRKGIELFIAAWRRLPEAFAKSCRLEIAGTGPLQGELESISQRVENIRFKGFVPFEGLPGLYQGADVLVMPSLEDPWGFVVNEAMASGLPVLCSAYAHAREMVTDGRNGYIFDPRDEAATCSVVMKMYENSPLLTEMARYSQALVRQAYSPETAARTLLTGARKILRSSQAL